MKCRREQRNKQRPPVILNDDSELMLIPNSHIHYFNQYNWFISDIIKQLARSHQESMGFKKSDNLDDTSTNNKQNSSYLLFLQNESCWMHKEDSHSQDLEYLYRISKLSIFLLSKVTEIGYSKLCPSERMENKRGRSKCSQIIPLYTYFASSMH